MTQSQSGTNGLEKANVRAASDRRSGKNAGAVSETGYGRLTQILREEILNGDYSAGYRLKVTEVARRFDTSTNPVREALQALEGEGLVTISPNRGASVREITEDLVHNVFDIRALLEPYIIRGFVEYASEDDIAALREIQSACEAAAERNDHPEYHRHNVRLHDYITDHHFNEEAIAIMRKHHGWLRALSRRNPMTKSQMRRASTEHWEFIEAAAKGDVNLAAQAIETHLRNSREMFVEKMRRDRMIGARRTGANR